jgi:hypothetical protein
LVATMQPACQSAAAASHQLDGPRKNQPAGWFL